MNRARCHKCGNQYSDQLKQCPKCGHEIRTINIVSNETINIKETARAGPESRRQQIKKKPIHFLLGISLMLIGIGITQWEHPLSLLLLCIIEILGVAGLPINETRIIIEKEWH